MQVSYYYTSLLPIAYCLLPIAYWIAISLGEWLFFMTTQPGSKRKTNLPEQNLSQDQNLSQESLD